MIGLGASAVFIYVHKQITDGYKMDSPVAGCGAETGGNKLLSKLAAPGGKATLGGPVKNTDQDFHVKNISRSTAVTPALVLSKRKECVGARVDGEAAEWTSGRKSRLGWGFPRPCEL